MRRFFKFIGYLGLVALLGGWFAIENVLPYWPIKPYRQNPEDNKWRLPQGTNPATYDIDTEAFSVTTADSVILQALYVPSKSQVQIRQAGLGLAAVKPGETKTQKDLCLIVLHGISSCKEFFLPSASYLAHNGIHVVLLDLRAHGKSTGEYCTFGYHEKNDISTLLDSLQKKYPKLHYGIYGHSLGGAIALQALEHDKRLEFGIVESTFHTLEAVIEQYGENYFNVRSSWLARHTLDKAAAIAQFDPYTIKPCESAKNITQPVFMAHGDKDERIPLSFGRVNFENLASTEKEWHTVHGAGHNQVAQAGGPAYQQAMLDFVKKRAQ